VCKAGQGATKNIQASKPSHRDSNAANWELRSLAFRSVDRVSTATR